VGGRERSYQGQEVSLDRQALLGVVHHVHELTDHRQVEDDVDPRYHLEALDYVRDEGREELPEAVELQDEPEEGEAVQNEGDPREIRRRADGLLFPEEEAPGLLQAEEEAEAHEKSDVTDREEEAIEDEHDAQEKAEHA